MRFKFFNCILIISFCHDEMNPSSFRLTLTLSLSYSPMKELLERSSSFFFSVLMNNCYTHYRNNPACIQNHFCNRHKILIGILILGISILVLGVFYSKLMYQIVNHWKIFFFLFHQNTTDSIAKESIPHRFLSTHIIFASNHGFLTFYNCINDPNWGNGQYSLEVDFSFFYCHLNLNSFFDLDLMTLLMNSHYPLNFDCFFL